mmetsp:Transcript_13163/g.30776  ORF Transcript_13163/g.30776 Transcript_13163/m.30776 type:complete len:150 (-) Transcript_13163:276-725(-)
MLRESATADPEISPEDIRPSTPANDEESAQPAPELAHSEADVESHAPRQPGEGHEGRRVGPTKLGNPDDVPDALPPGRVKMVAFILLFMLWVGGWSFLDLVAEALQDKYNIQAGFAFYGAIFLIGVVGIKVLACKYQGYALLDEIQEMT